MTQPKKLKADVLAISLTKPATKLGVPFIPFFSSIMAIFFAWMLYQRMSGSSGLGSILAFIAGWSVIYSLMFMLTSRDIFGLNIFWVNFLHFSRPVSFRRWNNTDSYQP